MGMVDIHCHLLPGIDDGPKSWETTLQMCEKAAADGVSHVVATPHCNDRYRYNRESHQAKLDELAKRFPRIDFTLGCDFHLSYENIVDVKENPERYTLGKTKYLLVEFSDFGISKHMTTVLAGLIGSGLSPIITHPERNPVLQRRFDMLEGWIRLGCLVQVTANSLTGFWGPVPKKVGETLLANRRVHLIASDAHDPERRSPVLSEACRAAARIVGEKDATALVTENPAAIVRGEKL